MKGIEKKMFGSRKGQYFLEVGLVITLVTLLVAGLYQARDWFVHDLEAREPAYLRTRVAAGSDAPGLWPVYREGGGGTTQASVVVRPLNSECEEEAQAMEDEAFDILHSLEGPSEELREVRADIKDLQEQIEDLGDEIAALRQDAARLEARYRQCVTDCEAAAAEAEAEAEGEDTTADADATDAPEADCSHCDTFARQAAAKRRQAQQKRDEVTDLSAQIATLEAQAEELAAIIEDGNARARALFQAAYERRQECWEYEVDVH